MSGTGMPASLLLEDFGALVNGVFGDHCYHVGSSIEGKAWRDVDVRVMLSEEDWEKWGLGDPKNGWRSARWVGLVRAFSMLGKHMTGLPIDFQIQRITEANAEFGERPRSALGISLELQWRRRLDVTP